MKYFLSTLMFVLALSNCLAQATNLYFEETFDRPKPQWYYSEVDSPDITKHIENGNLHVIQNNTSVYYTHCSAKLDPTREFKIKTDVTVKSSGDAGGVYILLFGEEEKNYYFGINAKAKSFWVGSEQKGTWETLNPYSAESYSVVDEAIKGENEVNELTLEHIGEDLVFSVNGKEMLRKPLSFYDKISRKVNYQGFATSSQGELFIDNYLVYQASDINLLVKEKNGLYLEKLLSNVNSKFADVTPFMPANLKPFY